MSAEHAPVVALDYEYDVFISYRRSDPTLGWVKQHFLPLLTEWLPNCLPIHHHAKIYGDWRLETGRARRKRDARLGGATSRCGRTIMANNAVVRRLENSGPRLDDRLKAFSDWPTNCHCAGTLTLRALGAG